ncbi:MULTISPECIES: ClpXP protease specificity-enhancing factor [unclassified Acinetobacter]|uniref:ClpXP protease specificity-enhancing factor n=1 Tax=unclassified Acinetobacter TaxID=196816 RepID=UPI0035B92EBB
MSEEMQLSPTRPYLAKAIYEWICDNNLTPYMLVDATQKGVTVPQQHVHDGQIVLNIAPHAVHQFVMNLDSVSFSARFGGVPQQLFVPMYAVMGIYSRENGQGLYFDPQEYDDVDPSQAVDNLPETSTKQDDAPKKKPSLRVLD